MENVRNICKIEFIKRDDHNKILRWQRKLTFNGIYKIFLTIVIAICLKNMKY